MPLGADRHSHGNESADKSAHSIGLTVAVIHHHVRGYPGQCLESLIAAAPSETEFLLIRSRSDTADLSRFPQVRTLHVDSGDRACAKNLAVAEARGEFLLLTTSDVVCRPGAIEVMRAVLTQENRIVSAQVLSENGTCRLTAYRMPRIGRELSPINTLRRIKRMISKPPTPELRPPFDADAFAMTFVIARHAMFQEIGPFTEGYRFAREDMEWCWRARQRGAQLTVVPQAAAFKAPPQLYGPLPPAERAAIEEADCRLAAATRGPISSGIYRAIRKGKALVRWSASASLGALFWGRSEFLSRVSEANHAVWSSPLDGTAGVALAPDVESHVRWET